MKISTFPQFAALRLTVIGLLAGFAGAAQAGYPLCQSFSGSQYCLADIPGIGPSLQGGVDTVYNAATGGNTPPVTSSTCAAGQLCVGAAKRVVSPSAGHIAGVDEPRAGGAAKRKQKFNLGGFGINPLQNLPDPFGAFGEQLTKPAAGVFNGSRGVEDLYVRAFVIEQADGTRVAFVTLDATGAGNVIQSGLRKAVNTATCNMQPPSCVAEANVLFGQTHTHAGPDLQGLWGGVPQDWIQNTLYKQAADAVVAALQNKAAARLTIAQGTTQEFNNYRRPRVDVEADSDGILSLMRARRLDNNVAIGSILQYSAHPTSIDENPRDTHPDFILGAMDWLEDAAHFGGTALYFNGPIADASGSGGRAGCSNGSDGAYGSVRCRGEGIADFGLSIKNETAIAPTLAVRSVEVTLPVTNPLFVAGGLAGSFNRYYDFTQLPVESIPGIGPMVKAGLIDLPQLTPTARTAVSRVTLGGGAANGLEIVTIPGEATNTFGQYIRSLSGTPMMLLGLTQNSFGYIIPEEEFSYVDASGDAGFTAPFTGYEEFVSMGPLTAPLLRSEGYNRLFDQPQDKDLPPSVAVCAANPQSRGCELTRLAQNLDYIQRSYADQCTGAGGPAELCSLLNPATPLDQPCRDAGFNSGFCSVFASSGSSGGGGGGNPVRDGLVELAQGCRDNIPAPFNAICVVPDTLLALYDSSSGTPAAPPEATLVAAAADAQARGCDLLDPAACLYPFPSDQFTVAAPAGSPQSAALGGTGKRVNFNILGMPRNTAGKPIDPTEWNRNDGFSPGAMILTYVPNLGTLKDADGKPLGPVKGAVPLTDLRRYTDADAPVLVLDAATGERHPIWAEIDVNAGLLLPAVSEQASPLPKRPALIIRPATNFVAGHRYVVVLRNLKDEAGAAIAAQAPFKACRDGDAVLGQLPPLQARCAQLSDKVFPVLSSAGIGRNASLYLAWDFTVASAKNDVARLAHMRDDAFASLGEQDSADGKTITNYGRAPAYKITEMTDNPDGSTGRTVRRIQGSITVPSYVTPADPAALRAAPGQTQLQQIADQCQALSQGNCGLPGVASVGDGLELAGSASLPPNRLFYKPTDAQNPTDLQGSVYGDGLPDRNPAGDLSFTFTCNIPRAAVDGAASMAAATTVRPVRPTLYGHGLLGGQGEGNGQASDFGNVYGLMTCAADWFGFATGDLANVASVLVDLSNFPAIPDGSQQGMLNQMFLARLAVHPQGFAADPNFQAAGQPVFDRREVFYHGNSQGGILGGVLVAASKDINRGVLGVLGMNYSTLLSRSTDFATYSIPLYLSYPDDLDRPFAFSLMQMLWDRSENNGYAAHIGDNAAMHGPDNQVLMQPAFGDHQVSMTTAEVMARTVGAKLDRHRIRSARHPDVDTAEYAFLTPVDYAGGEHYRGSALVPYDQMLDPTTGTERWNSQNDSRCDSNQTSPPPVGNVPPGDAAGDDPHECPRRDPQARCQASHFLLRTPTLGSGDTAPELVDVSGIDIFSDTAGATSFGCPAITITGAPTDGGGTTPPVASNAGGFMAVLNQFVSDFGTALSTLTSNPASAPDALQTAFSNLVDNLQALLTGDGDDSLATLVGHASDDPTNTDTTLADLIRDAGRVVGLPESLLGDSSVQAGVGVVDMTPDVGYCAGQYCAEGTDHLDVLSGGATDPYATAKSKAKSYGVQSRLTARAIVVQGANGKRIALLKTDNYLAQDDLLRRVGQLLDASGTSGIHYDDILYHVTHNHSAAYSATLSFGVWLFEDAYDARFFENQARKMAAAIEIAARNMKPARMGATTVHHNIYKGNVVRPSVADDLTPAGYPKEYNDHGLVVMRFDDVSTSTPKPLAVWINWGEHPESLNGYNLHSADYLASLERFVERDLGAPLVFSQGDVGSSENSGNSEQRLRDDGSVCEGPNATPGGCPAGQGVWRDWNHQGFVQTERNARYLADAIALGWTKIGRGDADVQVPMSGNFPVDRVNAWVPGPLSHPYPSVSNCHTETTAEGDVGVPAAGLPDCARENDNIGASGAIFDGLGDNGVPVDQRRMVYESLKAEGIPVPDHYDSTAFSVVEENARLRLQTFRIGEVLLASCACEAQNDLVLNLESRIDNVQGNIYDGFDWACLLPAFRNDTPAHAAACDVQEGYFNPAEYPYDLIPHPGASNRDPLAIAHMRAQVHNDAAGWDAPANVLAANSEPADISKIWGNFTKTELPPNQGYKLAVGVGHAGDYNGYTVSYREYMNRDSYRKALTAYGPHTADYMATRLVTMAGSMKGGAPLAAEPHDVLAQADEARQLSRSMVHGRAAGAAYDAYQSALPSDIGPVVALAQPVSTPLFSAATFRWRGGSTAVDNPMATVEKKCTAADLLNTKQPLLQKSCTTAGEGNWGRFADMTGEVQTRVKWPLGLQGVASVYGGQFAWEWTANFEAYRAFPARLGSTPLGSYRFAVTGCINDGVVAPALTCPGQSRPYQLLSNEFVVTARSGSIPRSYTSSFQFINDNDNGRFCERCSFRPWANADNGGADTDGDDVADGVDTCPNTVSGQAVDANGCSAAQLDADGDGVPDTADLCPGTASGQLVNAQGCSAAQRDSDGDGVKDDRDNCPNTPAGQAVDANGCPVVVPSDTTPDAYSFSNASGVARSTVVSSNAVTITGIDAPSPISVVGGEYRINGGAYTSQAGSISNGNTVQLRHTSAATANTKTETTLMVGGVSGKFSSTTAAATGDSDPDAFTFGSKSGQAQNTLVVSDAITPVGYDTAAIVKAGAGTEYSLGCTQSNWTAAQGSLTPGQSICVRHTSAGTANSLKKTSLQIGATVGYFSSRTAP